MFDMTIVLIQHVRSDFIMLEIFRNDLSLTVPSVNISVCRNQGKANDSWGSCDSCSQAPPIRSRMRNISHWYRQLVVAGSPSPRIQASLNFHPRSSGTETSLSSRSISILLLTRSRVLAVGEISSIIRQVTTWNLYDTMRGWAAWLVGGFPLLRNFH